MGYGHTKLRSKVGFTHSDQPSGKSIGAGRATPRTNTGEGSGYPAKGTGSQPTPQMGKIESSKRGSSLVHNEGFGHSKQPQGKDTTGAGMGANGAEHHRGHYGGGAAHTFRPPAASNADGYGHPSSSRRGPHRLSGSKGAHMVGKR